MQNITTATALPPSGVAKAIVRCLKARVVPVVRSSPGLGKSDIIRGIAKDFGLKIIDYRLAQCDVTDLNGLPTFLPDGTAEYAPFSDFPLEGADPGKDKDGNTYNGWLLFFDEITAAPKQLQAAAYKIILDRKIGQRSLHNNVVMVAAGNQE